MCFDPPKNTSDGRRELVRLREGEPWFAPAAKAFEVIQAGQATDADCAEPVPVTEPATATTQVSGSTDRRASRKTRPVNSPGEGRQPEPGTRRYRKRDALLVGPLQTVTVRPVSG